ncbi:cupin domain-containing protein [Streptomyces sp. NPDC042638]|uniref:JmjC domain-containing protein n=1 Tax=Streptomyces sp. NPDC042638 TaxID=3154333 RepID=UPI0033C4DDBC
MAMHAPTLAQWVGDPADFIASYWNKRPGVFHPEGGGHSSFTLADLDTAMSTGFFREPYVEMWDGDKLPARKFTTTRTVARGTPAGFADARRIRELLDKGATLLLRCVDQWHAPTRTLLASLAAELGRPVEAFFFVTPAGRQGLPLHRDDADVLVVQVAGSKTWHIHEGPADENWHAGRVTDQDGPRPPELLRTTLHPGDVLYVPRGFAHRASGDQGLSAHLSLTVREVGASDLVDTLRSLIAEELSLPERPLGEEALASTAARLLTHTAERLAGLDAANLVNRARARGRAGMPPAPDTGSFAELAAHWSTAPADGYPAEHRQTAGARG